ncbi:hypothetical protein Droror1_Dr00027937 [Drosera rotundifolia]
MIYEYFGLLMVPLTDSVAWWLCVSLRLVVGGTSVCLRHCAVAGSGQEGNWLLETEHTEQLKCPLGSFLLSILKFVVDAMDCCIQTVRSLIKAECVMRECDLIL